MKGYFYLFTLTHLLSPICIYKQYIDLIENLPLKSLTKDIMTQW